MKKLTIVFFILSVLSFAVSCAQVVQADQGYQLVQLYGYECITNNISIWCN